MKLAETLLQLARQHRALISTAESCTGGMVAAAITDIAGSSDIFERGFVTYSNRAKHEVLGVNLNSLETYGAVSEEVACDLADGALLRSHATLAVSITGIAGPGGSANKPEGRVCFGIARLNEDPKTETVDFGALGRDAVRCAARDHALGLLIKTLSDT